MTLSCDACGDEITEQVRSEAAIHTREGKGMFDLCYPCKESVAKLFGGDAGGDS